MKLNECMLRMDVVPQRISYIDGKPAHIAGEWPGIKSSKWNGSIRVLNQIRAASFNNPNPALPVLGRRHFLPKYCKENQHFNTVKLIKYPPKQPKKTGVKQFIKSDTLISKINNNKKVNNINTKTNTEIICMNNTNIKDNYFDDKFMPRKKYINKNKLAFSKEYNITEKLGSKKRLYNLEERRNFMPIISPGDKIYKNPEFSSDFFKLGELIPGSSNSINYKKNEKKGFSNFYTTINLTVKTLDDDKLWKNKVKNENLNFQINFVKNLNNWELKNVEDLSTYNTINNNNNSNNNNNKVNTKINKNTKNK